MNTKPLISFYVIACNQQNFVAEAVGGALAQTWMPLEVVLSDDCSDDATFEIMQNMAREYRGPHSIVLNQNEKRLGVGAHINKIIQLCRGEWIVASAGDDLSVPERTFTLYSHWAAQGKRASLVYSNILETKENGTLWYARDFRREFSRGWAHEKLSWDYHQRLAQQTPPVHGASFAYPRCIFDDFGPLWDGVVFEDNVLNWRAELCGGVSLCTDYLVRHRNHTGQLTNLYSRQAIEEADMRR
ncbi:MAG: glycosyltransferase, partial [Chloroflexota bacterium]